MAEQIYSLEGKRVFVCGHRGMVGSALVRRLASENCEVLAVPREALDLRDQSAVFAWMERHRPQVVFLAAAKVGGILANARYPADFLLDNMLIQNNVMASSLEVGVEKLLFLGSSCIYPGLAPQPLVESALLSGSLEPTNEGYAVAKIAGLKLCQAMREQHGADFISAMPTNLYGPGDNYDAHTSHVLPALLRKVHEAKASSSPHVTLWGTGTPLREFLHVDDCADALVFLMKHYSAPEHVNVGSGSELSIRSLATLICKIADYSGDLRFDTTKPDGTPRKRLHTGKLDSLGWHPRIELSAGITEIYRDLESQLGGRSAP